MPGAGSNDHIPQKAVCDLYLDSHWYNGHSTTGDMLYAGVPMITYPGESIAGRAAASFALSVGFPEMIVYSWDEYIERALYYINNPDRLKGLRKRLEKSRYVMPLFDSKRWVRNLERGFKEMWKIYSRGEKPRHIQVIDPVNSNLIHTVQ